MALHLWHDLSPGDRVPREVSAVVEIPQGSRSKFEVDKSSGLIKLDHFFEHYSELEGKKVTISGFSDDQKAQQVITAALSAYRQKFATSG